jgi:hypothetical protein
LGQASRPLKMVCKIDKKLEQKHPMTLTTIAIVIIAASFPLSAFLLARHYLGEKESTDSHK